MKTKVLMQNFWENKAKIICWDDPLPAEMCIEWTQFFKDMIQIEKLTFNRCVKPLQAIGHPTLIILSDASEDTYISCAYVRWKLNDGRFLSNLLCAKGRVTPIKRITIVCLKLCAVVIFMRLYVFINGEFRFKFEIIV